MFAGVHQARTTGKSSQPSHRFDMSLTKVQQALTAFLTAAKPQVVALSGKWGRGKSYYWNHFLASSNAEPPAPVKQASYVSLFGIPSIEALRDGVFENAVPIKDLRAPQAEADSESLGPTSGIRGRIAALASMAKRGARRPAKLLEAVPQLKELGPLLR